MTHSPAFPPLFSSENGIDAFIARLQTVRLGRRLVYLAETASTNAAARKQAMAGAGPGLVVATEFQTAGRGRGGNRWNAPANAALLFSAVLDAPGGAPGSLAAMVVSEAARRAASTLGAALAVKWPNDLMAGGRKICGVLCETVTKPKCIIAGVGMNVLGSGAEYGVADRPVTTMSEFLGRPVDRREMFQAMLVELEKVWNDFLGGRVQSILETLRPHLVEGPVETSRGRGVVEGIDDQGRLMVIYADGTRETTAEETR
jgi:BirA family transcriptional regulator, biotin operon repressor / biotin---[acetyl-CoA-carboxylase] ligase